MPYLGNDTVKANAERIIDAYAEGLDGLSKEDCQELVEDDIVTGKQCGFLQEALRGGAGGIVTSEEVQELRSSGLSQELVYDISGDDGRKALQTRVKWLGDVADGLFVQYDYEEVEALAELKLMGKEGISELCRIISSVNQFLPNFERAVYELSETADVTDPQVISAFIIALNGNENVRNVANYALFRAGEPAVSKLVESANKVRYEFDVNSRTEPVILRLATLIKLLGDINSTSPTIDSALIGMLSDRNLTPDIIERASFALVKRGPLAASAVALLLQDSDWRVRVIAADILGLMGGIAAFAVPQLEKCLRDPEEDVRLSALIALRWINIETEKSAKGSAPRSDVSKNFRPEEAFGL